MNTSGIGDSLWFHIAVVNCEECAHSVHALYTSCIQIFGCWWLYLWGRENIKVSCRFGHIIFVFSFEF